MEEQQKHPGGHPAEMVRYAWALRYGLTAKQWYALLTPQMCWQLGMCRSDEARRLLLGASRRWGDD